MTGGQRRRRPAKRVPKKVQTEDGEELSRSEWLHQKLTEGVSRLGSPEGWKAMLSMRSRMHHYSFRNMMLILDQKPEATMVAGYKDWLNKYKRAPIKGTAIYYWAHHDRWVEEPDEKTGEMKRVKKPGFHPTHGFDVSDTKPLDPDAPELPLRKDVKLTGQAPAALWDGLVGLLAQEGYVVERTPVGGGVRGDTSPDGNVRIDPEGTPLEQLAVLFHETAHVLNGHIEDIDQYRHHRGQFEAEAESVAWIGMTSCGLEVGDWSFDYINQWARGDQDLLKKTAEKVCKVSDRLVDALMPERDIEIGHGDELEVELPEMPS